MEIEVLTEDTPSAEQHRPLNCEGLGLGAEYDKAPLETIVEGLPGPLDREETTHEAIEPKAQPKRSAKAKAVRFEGARGGEAQEPLGERSAGSAPAEPKVKAKSRAKTSTRRAAEEVSLAQEAPIKEPAKEPVKELSPEAAAIANNWEEKNRSEGRPSGRGRPPGARNRPKPPQIVERVVEKTVYQKPPPLSPQDLQALLKETLRKQELDAREQKRAYYSQLIRRNR